MRVYLDSIGCRLNQAEIEALARRLATAGHEIVGCIEQADRIVLNSCAVTVEAARSVRRRARRFHRLRPEAAIHLTGCYATLAPEGLGALPGVTEVIDNQGKDAMALDGPTPAADAVAGTRPGEGRSSRTGPAPAAVMRELRRTGFGLTRAFVKVQDGCDKRCSFCITTVLRGAGRSRPLEEVLAEVRSLVAAGYQEVVLTGVHLGSYGQDLGRPAGLRDLVSALLARSAVPRLRLSSLEPWDIAPGFFELWQDPRLLPHLHLPLQAGCDRTLIRMARGTSTEAFGMLVAEARAAIPDLNLSTDLITGFPGESPEDFESSLAYVRQIGFGRLHVFPYSERPGTAAARMSGRVPVPERRARARRLIALGQEMTLAAQARRLGGVDEVLWERLADDAWRGYTRDYLPAWTRPDPARDLANRRTPVRLVASGPDGLEARLMDEG